MKGTEDIDRGQRMAGAVFGLLGSAVGGLTAQPSGKVWDAANNRVVPALVETNPPYCSVAASDAYAETQGVALLKPMPGNLAQVITHL